MAALAEGKTLKEAQEFGIAAAKAANASADVVERWSRGLPEHIAAHQKDAGTDLLKTEDTPEEAAKHAQEEKAEATTDADAAPSTNSSLLAEGSKTDKASKPSAAGAAALMAHAKATSLLEAQVGAEGVLSSGSTSRHSGALSHSVRSSSVSPHGSAAAASSGRVLLRQEVPTSPPSASSQQAAVAKSVQGASKPELLRSGGPQGGVFAEMSFVITNVAFVRLDSLLLDQMNQAVRETVSQVIGVPSEHLQVRLSAGSVLVNVGMALPATLTKQAWKAKLDGDTGTEAIEKCVERVRRLPGIGHALTGYMGWTRQSYEVRSPTPGIIVGGSEAEVEDVEARLSAARSEANQSRLPQQKADTTTFSWALAAALVFVVGSIGAIMVFRPLWIEEILRQKQQRSQLPQAQLGCAFTPALRPPGVPAYPGEPRGSLADHTTTSEPSPEKFLDKVGRSASQDAAVADGSRAAAGALQPEHELEPEGEPEFEMLESSQRM